MKNLTITVDDNALEWARIEAARRGSSVSRMVGDFLGEMQRREDAYEREAEIMLTISSTALTLECVT